MEGASVSRPGLARAVFLRWLLGVVVIGTILFVPAGTLRFWEAWLYMAVLFLPMFVTGAYLLRHSPALLERRMVAREERSDQARIVSLSVMPLIAQYLIPGFDQRWGWSDVPTALVLAAAVTSLVGYAVFARVMLENEYAARTVRVEDVQRVITTGPYAVVRHPMYVGVALMYLSAPIALDSYWAFLPALLIVPTLIARIRSEERVLERELDGYRAYELATPYRLVPRVW
jgi:protein-S-isoprenylcysteine O-methyltransferase Ste14